MQDDGGGSVYFFGIYGSAAAGGFGEAGNFSHVELHRLQLLVASFGSVCAKKLLSVLSVPNVRKKKAISSLKKIKSYFVSADRR